MNFLILRLSTLVAVLCLLLGGNVAYAQFPDLVDVSAQYMPGVALDLPPAKAQVSTYDVSINAPLPLAERTYLIPGASYHVDAVSYAHAPVQLDQIRLLQAVDLSLLFVQMLPRDWSLSVRVAGGLAGDFEAVDDRMLRVSTLVMATHAFSDRFVLGGGATTNYSFGSLLPLPVVYLDWRPLPDLQLETFLPAFAQVKYTLAKRVELGLRAEVAGNAYAIRSAEVANDWPCRALASDDPATPQRENTADAARCTDHVAYSVVTAGIQVGVRLFESVWLTGFGGRTLYRRLEPMSATNDSIDSELQTLPNAWTFRANLTWRLPQAQD